MTTSKRNLLTPSSAVAVAAVTLLLSGIVAGGCSKEGADGGGGAQLSAEQQIKNIQDNPNMPAFAKEQAIRSIQAGQKMEKTKPPMAPGNK